MALKTLWFELLRTAALVYPNSGLKEDVNRLKYVARALLLSPYTTQLLASLDQPGIRELAQRHPVIITIKKQHIKNFRLYPHK